MTLRHKYEFWRFELREQNYWHAMGKRFYLKGTERRAGEFEQAVAQRGENARKAYQAMQHKVAHT